MKLLIIEDEIDLSNSISEFLTKEDYLCEQAFSFSEARSKIEMFDYDCILLDIMLPDGNGLNILNIIKEKKTSTGVIIISAKNSIDDKICGMKIGADDYLAKPFNLSELSIRIYALLRRKNFFNGNIIQTNDLSIDLLKKEVSINGKILDLTKSEYNLLLFLIQNKKRVISKSALAEHISGEMADMMNDHNFIYAHIKNLKAKLSAAGSPNCIKTLYEIGYKWNEE